MASSAKLLDTSGTPAQSRTSGIEGSPCKRLETLRPHLLARDARTEASGLIAQLDNERWTIPR